MSNVNVMYQSACLVFNPITVGNYASFFYCIPNDRASDYYDPDIKLYSFKLARAGAFLSGVWPTGVQMVIFFSVAPDGGKGMMPSTRQIEIHTVL